MKICRCGCGENTNIITRGDRAGQYRDFLLGHNCKLHNPNFNNKWTDEQKNLHGIKLKGRFPSRGFAGRTHTKNSKKLTSKSMILFWKNNKDKAKLFSKRLISKYKDINERNRTAILTKAAFDERPEIKNIISEKVKKYYSTPSNKKKLLMAQSKNAWTSSIEIKIHTFLDSIRINYIKHKYINIEHRYNCDIYIPEANLIIEADGIFYHNYPDGKSIDKERNIELKKMGYNILRLWEHDIRHNFSICKEIILLAIACKPYYYPHEKGGLIKYRR